MMTGRWVCVIRGDVEGFLETAHHLGPPGIECINPLMHMGPVKLDSARFSRKCDISVSTEFPTTLVGKENYDDAPYSEKPFSGFMSEVDDDDKDDNDDDGNVNDERRANDM
ncbi:hypothetical protein HZH68_010326 [Vespula germanica]|uniref:Uncharacterized protein n=1 Tax=Vespula germanica TaxID=30212 RepID=A0A834JTZ8_VESGE|nr:hypothetical protein HZH68_010326 [Vespula germanica]